MRETQDSVHAQQITEPTTASKGNTAEEEIPPPPPPEPSETPAKESWDTQQAAALQPEASQPYGTHYYAHHDPQGYQAHSAQGYGQEGYSQGSAPYNDGYQYGNSYDYYEGCFTVVPPEPVTAPAPPAKRQKLENDGVASALTKIRCHIGNPKKFSKAAPLLRQLLVEGKVSGAHGDLVFACLKAAMSDPEYKTQQQAELRKEYIKLFSTASKCSQIFSAREKAQLDVYGLIAVLRNQLQTDDSFVLNRILSRIKQSISNLPTATPEDDAVLARLQTGTAPQTTEEQPGGGEAVRKGKGDSAHDESSADLEQSTWTDAEALCMKRDALISCLESAKSLHSKLWARTSIEIAYEEVQKQREKFCRVQQDRVDALARFAKSQRTARQQGRSSAKEDRRDRTAFETARKEWSKVAGISARGKVGAEGDHGSEVWLG